MFRMWWIVSLLLFGGLAFAQAQSPAAPSLLQELEQSLSKGEYTGFQKRIEQALEQTKGDEKMALQLANYRLMRNRRKGRSMLRSLAAAEKTLSPDLSPESQLHYHLSQAEALALHGRLEESLGYFRTAEAIDLPNPPHYLVAKRHYVHGKLLRSHFQDIVAGEKAFQEALAILAQLPAPDLFVQGDILRTLGNRARRDGDFPLSREYYERELRSYQTNFRPTHPEIGNGHYLLGAVYYEMMDYPAALEQFLACHVIWEQEFNRAPRYKKYLYESIGDMYWELDNRPKALEFYNRASEGESPFSRDSSEFLTAHADSLLAVGKYPGALQFYQKALAYRQKNYGPQHRQTAVCQNFVARAHAAAGEPTAALQAYERTIEMLAPENTGGEPGLPQQPVHLPDLLEALAGKGELLLREATVSQDILALQEAAKHLENAITYLEQLQQSPLSEQAKTYWNQRVQRLLEAGIEAQVALYRKTGSDNYLREAYLLSQKSRAFLLSTAIMQAEVSNFAGVPEAMLTKERELRGEMLHYQGTIQGEEKRCAEAREKQLSLWWEQLDILRTQHQLLLNEISVSYPDYHALKYRIPLSEPALLQAALAERGAALIETFVGEQSVYIFLLAEGRFTLHSFPVTGPYTHLVTAFQELSRSPDHFIADPAGSYLTYCQTAHDLYSLLLAPLLDSLPSNPERLVLVTAQALATTPFAALLTSTVENQARDYRQLPYLGRKYALSYAPSASLWLAASDRPKRSGKSYAGFAPDYAQVQYASQPAPAVLREAQREIREAGQIMGGESYLGTAATETAFRQQSAALIHLAAHALIDEAQPLQSRILLHAADSTEDGLLHAHELYGLQLSAQLSLLGACHTAAGPYQSGEGILSIERAFLYAGCPSVVSSLWASEDAAAATINGYFLAALQQGEPKDIALQTAQFRYLEESVPGTENPFFWAGHRLAGSTTPLSNPWWKAPGWWGFAGLLLVVGGGLWFRKRT